MNRRSLTLLSCMLFLSLMLGAGRAIGSGFAAATPNRLDIAQPFDISTLDPALAYDSASFEIISNLYDPLVRADPADPARMQPMLATGWTVSADGLTYRFTIRRGVAFHNGATLSAADVAYSLQRGLLQSDPGSPQWMLIGAIMGYPSYDITQEIAGGAYIQDPEGLLANADPAELLATCQKVKSRVAADAAAGTVTITLAAPNGGFLNMLGEYGHVLNAEWAAAQADWDGDCATWQHFYAPSMNQQGSRLADAANGTGPFLLNYWTPDSVIQLDRHRADWRARPNSAVPLDEVVITIDSSSSTFPALLVSGATDMASLPSLYYAGLDDHVLLHHAAGAAGPVLVNPDGVLTRDTGFPYGSATDLFLNFNIATGGPRNYIGSGLLDGNGVPPTFFSDSHVRRAFAYAFDYDAHNDAMFGGLGIRRTGPAVKPLMGYDPDQPVFAHDPTQAAAEMAQAWGGQVAAQGFRLTLAYNQGNAERQMLVELLESGIEALDPKYQIDVISLPFPDYNSDQRQGYMPVLPGGWFQDYAHPNMWMRPYLWDTFAIRQNMPEPMRQAYGAQIDQCLLLVGNAARGCYETLQAQAYNDVTAIYTNQPVVIDYARNEVNGLDAARQMNYTIDFSRLWKGGTAVAQAIQGTAAQTMGTAGASGMGLELAFPAGALGEPRNMLLRPDIAASGRPLPAGMWPVGLAFSLTDWEFTINRAADLTFAAPVEATITYSDAQIVPRMEDDLTLFRWDGAGWTAEECGPIVREPAANRLRAPLCETGEYILMGPSFDIYLPGAIR